MWKATEHPLRDTRHDFVLSPEKAKHSPPAADLINLRNNKSDVLRLTYTKTSRFGARTPPQPKIDNPSCQHERRSSMADLADILSRHLYIS